MVTDIKSLFDEVKTEILAKEHPLFNADSSVKHAYLTGLAIIAATNAEDDFTEVEKEYLNGIAAGINLSEELYKNALTTAKKPDKSVVKTIVETIEQRHMQFLFLIDAYNLSKIDGNISETENHIINSFKQFFKFTNENCLLLERFMSAIEKNDIKKFKLSLDETIDFEENMKKDILKYYFSEAYEKYLKEFEFEDQYNVINEELNRLYKEDKEIEKKIDAIDPRYNIYSGGIGAIFGGMFGGMMPPKTPEISKLIEERDKYKKKISITINKLHDLEKKYLTQLS